MDSGVSCDDGGSRRLVVLELSHIRQLVAQLEVHLGQSPDLCKRLASQIFSLTERSIGMITSSSSSRKRSSGGDADLASATPSPLSGVGNALFKSNNKKRKMMEKRTHQVRVSPGGGETPPVDDGHSWRKYGQKEILGAKHPRSYYRCTHRHSKGCAATKQVQRTDEDPELFDVFYLGAHTCCLHKTAAAGQATPHNPDAHGLLQSMSASLTVKTDGLAVAAAEPLQGWSATVPFRFSSTPVSGGLAPEWSPFSSAPSANWSVSPATTSDSNHAALLPPFFIEAAAGDAEVVSAHVAAASTPAVGIMADDFLNVDISSFLCDPTQVADEQ